MRTRGRFSDDRFMSAQKAFGIGRTRELPLRALESADDGELIRRIGERDRDAFEVLYRRFARPVLGLAIRRLRDRGRAEDATQETFASIWRSAGTFRPERGRGAQWLYGVARNAIVNQLRTRVDAGTDASDSTSEEPGPPEWAESDWVSRRLHRAVGELPAHHRAPIELAYWSGLSQSEIATRLNVPLGTVKTRTRNALSRLAELLDDELQYAPTPRREIS